MRNVANYLAMLLVVGGVLAALGAFPPFQGVGQGYPEIQISLVIVLAIAVLIILLYVVASGFSHINLADRDQALGLPQGSIRALIALFLVMLFVIIGLFLFRIVGQPIATYTLTGLQLADVTALGDRVLNVRQNAANPATFDAIIRVEVTPDGARLAQQLVTTVGTLVVAVAGFYFGTSAVTAASAAATSAVAGVRSLSITTGSPLPSGKANQDYPALQLSASGGLDPYTWTVVGGTQVPADLNLSPSGLITGQPKQSGKTSFIVQVVDKAGIRYLKEFEIDVT